MWALTHRAVAPLAVLPLRSYQEKRNFDSSMWLLRSHLPYFGGVSIPETEESVSVPSRDFWVDSESPAAIPLSLLSKETQKFILLSAPLPAATKMQILVVDANSSDSSLCWRRAREDEVLDATVYGCACGTDGILLCSSSLKVCDPLPSRTDGDLLLFNAQQCSNPFAMDSTLQHIDLSSKKGFPPSIAGGLTTIASQFQYKSFHWLREADVAPQITAENESYSPLPGATPHNVLVEEEVPLVHVSQLSAQAQSTLLAHVPRYVLLDGFRKPFVYVCGRWRGCRALGLTEKLRHEHIPICSYTSLHGSTVSQNSLTPQPLLWVHRDSVEAFSGSILVRHRTDVIKIFHSSQLHRVDE